MNCSIGSGQTYFSLSCSIFLFFSLWITYSVVHAILSISVSFEHCVFLEHKLPVGGASWKLHSPKYAWVQKQYGHFAWVSYLQNTVSVEIHRMCNIWTEMKLTVLCHIALGNYMHNNWDLLKSIFPVEFVVPRLFFAEMMVLYLRWCTRLDPQVPLFKRMNTITLEFSVNGIMKEQWALFWSSSIVNACTCNWFGISPGGILPTYTCQRRRDRKFTLRYSQIE